MGSLLDVETNYQDDPIVQQRLRELQEYSDQIAFIEGVVANIDHPMYEELMEMWGGEHRALQIRDSYATLYNECQRMLPGNLQKGKIARRLSFSQGIEIHTIVELARQGDKRAVAQYVRNLSIVAPWE